VVVVDEVEDAAAYSFRNLPKTVVLTVDELGIEAILWARSLLVSETALDRIHWVLGERETVAVTADAPVADEAEAEPATEEDES
jgi:ribosomal protein L4